MGDGRPPHPVGGEDESPAIAYPARGRAASPARQRVADADPAHPHSGLGGEFRGVGGEPVERVPAKPAQQPRLQALGRSADDQPSLLKPERARPLRAPVDPVRPPVERQVGPGRERRGRRDLGQAGFDPVAMAVRPGQCLAARGPLRNGQNHLAGAPVDPKPNRPGRRRDAELQFKAHARPDDARGRRLRLRPPSSRGPTFRRGARLRGRRRRDNASREAAFLRSAAGRRRSRAARRAAPTLDEVRRTQSGT